MFGFNKNKKSGKKAADRLKLIIYQDRIKTNPQTMEMLKQEIMEVISRYMDIDDDDLRVNLSPTAQNNEDGSSVTALEVNIPIKGWKMR